MTRLVPTEELAYITMLQRFGIPYTPRAHSTLNQFLNILPTANIPVGKYPVSRYIVFGNGGHANGSGPGPTIYDHAANYKGLYNLLPIVLRPLNNDLTPMEREGVALRAIVSINNVDYVAYYALRIDGLALTPTQEIRQIDPDTNELVFSSNYVPVSSEQTPPKPSIGGEVSTTNKYIGTFLTYELHLNSFFIAEFAKACQIIYGSTDNAIISEIGYVSGIDKIIQITEHDGATQNDFTEAIACVITGYMAYYSLVKPPSTDLRITTEISVSMPLINLNPV